jgi:methionyl-tRNA formyltransferase
LLAAVLPPADVLVIAPEPRRTAPWHVSLLAYAQQVGVRCIAPPNVNDDEIVREVQRHEADLLLSIYYTQVFRPQLLDVIRGPALNFHPSLLPRHRGVAPLIWAIAEGDPSTGLTVHHIDEGIDTGRVVGRYPMPIHPEDTGYSLHRKMARLVRAVAAWIVRDWLVGHAIPAGEEQSGPATYHTSRDPQLNHLDWSESRRRIRNVVRALAPPLPGAFTILDGERLTISRVQGVAEFDSRWQKPPGMVELRHGQAPIVWAHDGPLEIVEFMDGDRPLHGRDLPRVRGLTEGHVLR